MNYKDLALAIEALAATTCPNATFVSGLRQRQDEALAAALVDKDLVWLVDVQMNGLLPSNSEVRLVKIAFGTRYDKQDLSSDEATKIGDCQELAYGFMKAAYQDITLLGQVQGYNLVIAYEGFQFTEYVGVVATITIANKIDCWDY